MRKCSAESQNGQLKVSFEKADSALFMTEP